jgi:myo-inositol-1(or 4)-monophosphatase
MGGTRKIGDAIVAMGSPPAEESMKVRAWDVQALIPKVQYDSHVGECRHYVGVVANGRLTATGNTI